MTIREFNNIIEFNDVVVSTIKDCSDEYREFITMDAVLEPMFVIAQKSNKMIYAVTLCAPTPEQLEELFADDLIICTIDKESKINNYKIKRRA